MADRGKPIPIAIRVEIKERCSRGETIRSVASSLRVCKTTVEKYGTRPLNARKESA